MKDPCGHLRSGHAAICRGERDDLPHERRVAYLLKWHAEGKIGDEALIAAGIDPGHPPTLVQRAKSFGRAIGRTVRAAVTGKCVTVPEAVRAARRAACNECPKENADDLGIKWCGACGCMLGAKQRIATETCPLGRWPTDSLSE